MAKNARDNMEINIFATEMIDKIEKIITRGIRLGGDFKLALLEIAEWTYAIEKSGVIWGKDINEINSVLQKHVWTYNDEPEKKLMLLDISEHVYDIGKCF